MAVKGITKRQSKRLGAMMPERHFLLMREIIDMRQAGEQVTEQNLVDRLYGHENWSFFEDIDGKKCSPRGMLVGSLLDDLGYLYQRGFAHISKEDSVSYSLMAKRVYNLVLHPIQTGLRDFERKASHYFKNSEITL